MSINMRHDPLSITEIANRLSVSRNVSVDEKAFNATDVATIICMLRTEFLIHKDKDIDNAIRRTFLSKKERGV